MKLRWRPLAPGETDHELIWSLVGLFTIGCVVFYFALPAPPPIRCAFHVLTGYPCLTCGSTRALIALGRLDLVQAFRWNPLGAAAWAGWILYILYGLPASLAKAPRLRLEMARGDWIVLRALISLALILNWIWVIVDGR